MSTVRSRGDAKRLPDPPDGVTVVSWPLRDRRLGCLVVIVATMGVATAAGRLSQSLAMGCLVQGVLVVGLWRLWIPVTFQLGISGIVETVLGHPRYIDWMTVTRVQLQGRGVLLLADRTDTPLAAIHGIFIPWHDQREQIIRLVEHFVWSRIERSRSTAD